MIAFEVYLNGTQVCTAGVGELGVLSAHVCWVRRKAANTRSKKPKATKEELTMDVGGLIRPTDEYVRWHERKAVQVGDEVRIKVIQTDAVDEPPIRRKKDPAQDEQRRKAYGDFQKP